MTPADSLAELVPHPEIIHRRLSDLARERALLRRQLRLSLDSHRECERRTTEAVQARQEAAHAK